MNVLDKLLIASKVKAAQAKERVKEFYTGEDGVSNVVATIIILLVVVLIIGVLWNRLSPWLNDMMDKIFNFNPSTTSDTEL